EVPFNFEINSQGAVFFLNAGERFESGKIRVSGDSAFIPLDQFNNELALRIGKDNMLHGVYRSQEQGTGITLAVRVEKGKTHRFPENNIPPATNISGKYEAEFITPSGARNKAVILLSQQGKKLTGSFLKISGDSRYLEGM